MLWGRRQQVAHQSYQSIHCPPCIPSIKFRIIKDYEGSDIVYIVQEIATSYCYGEALGAFGWCNAHHEWFLEDYFEPYYTKISDAKKAIARYRQQQGPEDVIWEEEEEKEND